MNKKNIEKLIDKFNIEEICQLLDFDLEKNISELKLNDFLVDIRGNNKYDRKIKLLKSNVKTDIALKYIKEIEVINQIFVECAKLQNKINSIPPKLVLPLMIFWGSHDIDKYMNPKATQFLKENNADTIVAYEKNAEMTIKAIKSLMYNEKLFDGDKFIYKFKSVGILFSKYKYQKCIMDYIMNSHLVSHWLEKYNFWKKCIYTISIIDEHTIKLNITNKELIQQNTNPYIKERIGRVQYETQAITEYNFIKKTTNPNFDENVMEFISQKILDKHFYCKSNDILIQNVKISEWLRAYFTLYKISQSDTDKTFPTSFISCYIIDHIICKTKEKWIKIFVKNGISLESAKIIFDHLVFKKNSTDLYDYPFIPVNNKYLISRTISKWIHPAQSLISRFNSKDINIDIKGRNFEKNLYTLLDMTEIPYVKMHNKVNGNEYECDAIFYLDNTFVFCECKSRTGHEQETIDSFKYVEDANQLNRISRFYKQNMNLVFDAFEMKGIRIKDKKFYNTKNIVIHSGSVDGVIHKDGVYIMDFDNFIIPFDRGSIFEDYINDRRLKNVFEGNINIYKLFKFYDYDFCVYDYRNKIIYKDNDIQLGNMKLQIEDYHLSDFFNEELIKKENKIHLKNLLRQNGIPETKINEIINK